MAYTLNRTDGTAVLTVADGAVDFSRTLGYIGKNYATYGEIFNENFLKLQENFANTSPPTGPIEGQLWWDKTNLSLKIYQGAALGWRGIPVLTNIQGTANQITVTITGANATLSLPQNINVAATPTFSSMTLSTSSGAPLTVNSASLVTNLNADKLDGQHGSYYLDYTNLTNKPAVGAVGALNSIALGTNTTGNYVASLVQGTGIALTQTIGATSTPTVAHGATSTISNFSSVNSEGTYIRDLSVTFDTFGHVTSMSALTANEKNGFSSVTIDNSDSGYTWTTADGAAVSANTTTTDLDLVAGSGIVVAADNVSKSIKVEHSDTSSQATVDNVNGTVIQDIALDGFGHVTSLGSVDLDVRYYTQSQSNNAFVAKSGSTMTGALTLPGDPTLANHAATKQYVDNRLTFTYGTVINAGYTNGGWDNSNNYFDVLPPVGKTMSNLVAFIPSLEQVHFAGRVNDDDSLRCTYSIQVDRIRVWTQNTEQRSPAGANYLAVWN